MFLKPNIVELRAVENLKHTKPTDFDKVVLWLRDALTQEETNYVNEINSDCLPRRQGVVRAFRFIYGVFSGSREMLDKMEIGNN